MESKEELKKKLAAIEEQETEAMIAEHYPKIRDMYEGKYFKSRNSYGGPQHWWVYTKVVEIKPSDIYDTRGNGVTSTFTGWKFETDKYGSINVTNIESGYVHLLENEISEKEFMTAWGNLKKNLEKIANASR